MRWRPAPYLLSLVIVLCGCSATGTLQDAPPGDAAATLSGLSAFKVNGRIAVQTATDASSAAITWLQRSDTDATLTLSGPLGMQATTLRRDGEQISLQQGDEIRWLEPEQLLSGEAPDWPLPLAELGWWLRGLPAPAQAARQIRSGDRLSRLEQSGWTLQYEEYQTFNGLPLPRRIRFSRDDVSGKLLLKNWTFSP
ncbi:MAG: lipoprotein insertase outer membrane protein LolB [Halieaceae bacterium]|jgi:outer membrane lipoprotein LolB|nr:lipoprotein insertase outer membrane protein LolB [Halieaceae bacterium]